MKNQTCCFTGHRDCKDDRKLRKRLKLAVTELITQRGVRYFCAGGALGFDTIAARCIIRLKRKYPHIRLILILPCPEQDRYWSDRDKAVYKDITDKADRVVYTSLRYTRGCMHRRNRCLVDNSAYCIAYCGKNAGGTYYTLNYAAARGLEIINLWDVEENSNQ